MKNPCAFPVADEEHFIEGMRMRSYYAAQAMQALIARWNTDEIIRQSARHNFLEMDMIAKLSFEMADAMLLAEQTTGVTRQLPPAKPEEIED